MIDGRSDVQESWAACWVVWIAMVDSEDLFKVWPVLRVLSDDYKGGIPNPK